MLSGKKIVVVLPAFNAANTLERTYEQIPFDYVDDVLLVDDASHDETVALAKRLGIRTIIHPENRGYGGNQKTCYQAALDLDADIIVMLHPDYQYPPALLVPMAGMIACGEYDVVLASRILGRGALKGGMPVYKYLANRVLTFLENLLLWSNLSEYHSGYRAFSRTVLESLTLERNSDGFIFDNQILAQVIWYGFRVGEISCPTRYLPESSSINFRSSVLYGFGVLWTAILFRLARLGLCRPKLFPVQKKSG